MINDIKIKDYFNPDDSKLIPIYSYSRYLKEFRTVLISCARQTGKTTYLMNEFNEKRKSLTTKTPETPIIIFSTTISMYDHFPTVDKQLKFNVFNKTSIDKIIDVKEIIKVVLIDECFRLDDKDYDLLYEKLQILNHRKQLADDFYIFGLGTK